jgi:HKD family nuclease
MDLTFITNENGKTLKERFEELIKDCKTFDCIVGYFYISGFHLIYKSLENAEKIRILVGIGVDEKTYKLIKFSNSEVKQYIRDEIENELSNSDDNKETEEGIRAFVEWIKNKKLEIRAYPSRNLHAKLYIFTFKEKDRDVGRVITGSSNFTQSGLIDNLEFNVELKNRADYEFAKSKFEELWEKAIDVSETYVKTIYNETWLKEDITPYELYLKFLYEYFKDELNKTSDTFMDFLPENFKELNYQKQAVFKCEKNFGGIWWCFYFRCCRTW